MNNTTATPTTPQHETSPARPWWAASVLLAATALSLLTSTIVNVALPAMQRDLALSPAAVAWAVAGWALAYAIPLIPAGRLGDRIGHRRVFLVGITLFTLASIACALSHTEWQLVAARILQGAAGGVFYPAIAALLSTLFTGRDRARALAIMGAVIGVAAAVGPLLGGLILQALPADQGWRAVFLLNLPLGLIISISAALLLRDINRTPNRQPQDHIGLLLLTLGLTGILTPLIIGQELSWPLWGWGLLTIGILTTIGFLFWESHLDRHGGLALLPPRLLRLPRFSIPVAISFVQFAGFVSIFYVLALLWETGLGHTPLEMGLLTLPEAIGSIIGSWAITRIIDRIGIHSITTGSALLAAGMIGIWATLAYTPAAELTAWTLAIPLFITGLGTGTTMSPILNYAIAAVPATDAGSASGIIATVQRLGNAVGLAAASAVFFTTLSHGPASDDRQYVTAAAAGLLLCAGLTLIGLLLAAALSAISHHHNHAAEHQ